MLVDDETEGLFVLDEGPQGAERREQAFVAGGGVHHQFEQFLKNRRIFLQLAPKVLVLGERLDYLTHQRHAVL